MKKILALILILILGAGAYLGTTYYPLYKTYRDMKDAVSFSGDYSIKADEIVALKNDNTSSIPDGALAILEFLESGTFEGEYVDGIAHIQIYKDGTETAVAELSYNQEKGLLINVGQMAEFGLDYYGDAVGIFKSWLMEKLSPYMNMYISYDQVMEIVNPTDESGDRDLTEGDQGVAALLSAYKPSDLKSLLALIKALDVKTCEVSDGKTGSTVKGLSATIDEAGIPAVINVKAWPYPEDQEKPAMPEAVELTEDQIKLFQSVMEMVK